MPNAARSETAGNAGPPAPLTEVAGDFSVASQAAMLRLRLDYGNELEKEAVREARRNRSDVVSAADVEAADRKVRSGGRRRSWREATGGITAGAGFGTFLQLALEADPSPLGLVVAAVIGSAGLVLISR